MKDIGSNGQAGPLRVLVADGSATSSGGLRDILAEYDDIEIVGCARKAIEALTLVEKLQPDAVLLDIEMPGETLGFVLDLIKRDRRPPAVIVLIPYASSVLRERGLDAGADYVFAKTSDPERIINALQKLANARQPSTQCK
jgi:DNA-binding NarL/FixJ family response regulator